MIISRDINEVQDFIRQEREIGKKIGFVPTMGALHDGHLSLVHACKQRGLSCVMSIFVNPTQFGPNEDFTKYPRPIDIDKNLALAAGANLLFIPSVETLYPKNDSTFIDPPEHLNAVLCGPFRPSHFRGVCTVVHRFLNIVQPDELFLGQKDAQQFRILQETMRTLHPNIVVTDIPTMREKSGLAMSSRNRYLSEENKQKATIIYKALTAGKKLFDSGERDSKKIIHAAHNVLENEAAFKIQYLELVQWIDFQKTQTIQEKSLLALAGYLDDIRMIDNVLLIP